MSAPRTKRQFAGAASDPAQRRITSFFNSSGPIHPSTPSDESSPKGFSASDATVQANLLSVGMRVRKAVPEGYKTVGYSAFSLWDENRKDGIPTSATPDTGRPRPDALSTPRELLPFCGINKIGGFGTQESSVSDEFAFSLPSAGVPLGLVDPDAMDDVPGLTLSQKSVESNDLYASGVTGTATRKRCFADEEDEILQVPDQLNLMGWQDFEVSPRSLAPVDLSNSRRMAMPRKGGLKGKNGAFNGAQQFGQENAMMPSGDFEDASFLDQSLEVDMDDV
ncbi:ribonucleotide reductase inhibitor-domain-containing protein [Truncatella angustata]|uniref:Ribonucleotide reductase inhibitor-domain-containing protein n=1 Tax=Truncatella angustata TaxID=152316 RepID=A0A9P8URT5_9PEZI|nr:ribonucleotide reductase inhibitor-domain-containing protein [Truncatella angustata]KAH6657031.1 ribonucleotide reductase inhibitor-domain-containing protein [Truncatella angustata]KAH8198745.1 hypothetical protein TruAng_007109 [Truncatella angustata]